MITVSKLLFSKSLKNYRADTKWSVENIHLFNGLSIPKIIEKLKELYCRRDDGDNIVLYVIMNKSKTIYTLAVCSDEESKNFNIITNETFYR